MPRSLPPYTSLFLSLAVAALLPALAAADMHPDPAGRVLDQIGSGTWGPDDGTPHAANASWLLVNGQILAFRVTQDGTSHDCYGNATEGGGNITTETDCGGRSQDNGTVILQATRDGTIYTGTFQANTRSILLDANDEDADSLLPGFIVASLAALFLTTTIILTVLYVQERRVAHYLVRRLYEETKGRLPADWPENLRQQWVARVFVRGKN